MSRRIFSPKALELFAGGYRLRDLQSDILSGISVGLTALPLALALGIASVPVGAATPSAPPALGLYTAIIGGFLISALGGSRFQIGGPTAAFIPLILLIINQHGYSGLILATIMSGVFLLVMGFCRMGVLIRFIPWPITSGFTTGIAVAIILTQIPHFLALQTEGAAPVDFPERLRWLASALPSAHTPGVVLGVASLAFMILWGRYGWKKIPGAVLAMIGATLLVTLTGIEKSMDIATIGSTFGQNAIPAGLPGLVMPPWDFALVRSLIGPAIALALLGAIESLLSAVVADGLSGQRHDSNTELIAQGVANILCPLFGGFPCTGAVARTSSNINNGARSPVSGMVHAAFLMAIILVFAPVALHVPIAAMAAVLCHIAMRMGEWGELRRLHKIPRSDALLVLTTLTLTVVFDLVIAVEVGMVLAAIFFIKRVSETTEVSQVTPNDVLESHEQLASGKTIPDGAIVLRIFGPFLFGAAEKMEAALSRLAEPPRVLIVRMHLVTAMDATALHTLVHVVGRFRRDGGSVILSGLHRQPLDMLRRADLIDTIHRANIVAHFDDALNRAREILQVEDSSVKI